MQNEGRGCKSIPMGANQGMGANAVKLLKFKHSCFEQNKPRLLKYYLLYFRFCNANFGRFSLTN